MSAYTPGPWEWENQILVRRIQSTDPNVRETDVGEWDWVVLGTLDDMGIAEDFISGGGRDFCDWSCNEANARLIAAAPDSHEANVLMVDALNVAFGITSDHDDDFIYDTLPTSSVASAYFAARAAIAKATQP